jgi:hypothetical protein
MILNFVISHFSGADRDVHVNQVQYRDGGVSRKSFSVTLFFLIEPYRPTTLMDPLVRVGQPDINTTLGIRMV